MSTMAAAAPAAAAAAVADPAVGADAAPGGGALAQLRIPTFYGTEDKASVLAFLDRVETVQGGHHFDDVRMANFVRFAMAGRAVKWLNTVRSDNPDNVLDWTLLRPIFEARWLPPLSHEEAHTLQTALSQTDKLDVRSFWDDCTDVQDRLRNMFPPGVLAADTYPDMKRAMIISRFINGLRPAIRDAVLAARIQGHDAAAAALVRETAITAEARFNKGKPTVADIAEVAGLDDTTQADLDQALADTKEQFIEAIQNGKYRTSNNYRGRPQSSRGRGNFQQRPSADASNNKPHNGNTTRPNNGNGGNSNGGWRAVNNNWRSNNNGNGGNHNGNGNGGGQKRKPKCGACLEDGHFMRECPMMAAFRKQHQGGKQLAAIEYAPTKEVATVEAAEWDYHSTPNYPFC